MYNHGSECVSSKIMIFNNNYPCKILKVGNITDFTRWYKFNAYN